MPNKLNLSLAPFLSFLLLFGLASPAMADTPIPGEITLSLQFPDARQFQAQNQPSVHQQLGLRARFMDNRIHLNISMMTVNPRRRDAGCLGYAILCNADIVASPYTPEPESEASLGLEFDDLDYTYYLKANAEWDDEQRAQVEPDLSFDRAPRTRVNLRIGLSSTTGSWTVEVWGSNSAEQPTRNLADLPVYQRPGDFVNASPRSYGLTLKSNF